MGRLRFLTRLGDVLKIDGENMAAAELEDYLCEHPAVGIVQGVVGAPDTRYGEVAAAFVQLRPGSSATEQEIIDFCRGRISTFGLKAGIVDELTERGITEAPRMSSQQPSVAG